MLKEFRDFAMKGNVVDMAIGVIIGGAFGKIVTSLVEDLIMPIFSKILGSVDFSNYFIALDGSKYPTLAAAKEAGVATFNYGLFINTVIEFLIIAFSIFIVIKQMNKLKTKEEVEEVVTTKTCPYCLTDIKLEASRCPNCTSQLETTSQ